MIYYVTVFHAFGVGTFIFGMCMYKRSCIFHQSSFSIVVAVTETETKTKRITEKANGT